MYGSDLKELFDNAAFAMFDVIADLEGIKGSIVQDLDLKAPNLDELLVSWLDELLYNFYTKSVIFYKFDIEKLTDDSMKAKAYGRLVGENRNRLKTEIKAVTYHNLHIKKNGEGYAVEIIFDV